MAPAAHPPHRVTQEVGGAPSDVSPACAEPDHQHVAGSGGDGQHGVIAPLAGVAVGQRWWRAPSLARP